MSIVSKHYAKCNECGKTQPGAWPHGGSAASAHAYVMACGWQVDKKNTNGSRMWVHICPECQVPEPEPIRKVFKVKV